MISKFDDYFKVHHNVILEWARFNRCNQFKGESVELHITVLYTLIETGEYGDLTEELLCDGSVVGISKFSISECLQMDSRDYP